MKTHRVSFAAGINTVGDKAIPSIGEGAATILDNVDLRSGSAKSYHAPEFQFAVDATTGRSWSYRGRWFHSTNWRDYAGEFIGGRERVYFTEGGKYPKKAIEGTVAYLGTPRPKTVLAVASASNLSPSGLTATEDTTGLGNIQAGTYVYRVAARSQYGVLMPSAPVSITITEATAASNAVSVILTWGAVPKAKGYVIFKGDNNDQATLHEVNAAQLTFTDTGSKAATGVSASVYINENEITYAYTYKRRVNGVVDESGLSAPSIPKSGSTGRTVTRDMLNDGYFSTLDANTDAFAVVSDGAGTMDVSGAAVSLESVVVTFDPVLSQTVFEKTTHGMATGESARFVMSDSTWNGKDFEVIRIDADRFAVKDVAAPTDGSPLPAGTSYRRLNATVGYSASGIVQTGDVVYLKTDPGATEQIDGFYKATYISDTEFSVPYLAAQAIAINTIKWIPDNGYYWKWCLYRNEQGGWFLVEEIDMDQVEYTDSKPFSALSGTPSSFYVENNIDIDYDIPPFSLTGIVSHYGMLFGISGHSIRWTPTLAPDAWPSVNSVTMGYKPVALASFSQGLIILCQDAIYRLDGNSQTLMSLSKTNAEDGCFAPHSVQKTEKGLVYLSKRGVMLFNGTHAECITDMRVNGRFLTAPSKLSATYPFWWLPTIMTRNYADLAGEDGILGSQYAFTLDNTRPIDGLNESIKSIYHQGKYYLFYAGSDYEANTAVVIDMQMPGMPITTLGIKIVDAHVDEYENAYVLLDNAAPTTTVTITSPA